MVQQQLFPPDKPKTTTVKRAPAHYTCPNGHEVNHDSADTTAPTCHKCQLIADHYNAADKVVYHWSTVRAHEQAVENLQAMMDDAFDNQYFSDGGW